MVTKGEIPEDLLLYSAGMQVRQTKDTVYFSYTDAEMCNLSHMLEMYFDSDKKMH